MTNDAWSVIVNLDFSPYKQTIAKLKDDLLYMQKFKMPLSPVYEMNHIEYIYILQKLEDEIAAFNTVQSK